MYALSMHDTARVGGGNPLVGVLALAAVGAWVWSNRGAINDVVHAAIETSEKLNEECGG